MLTRQRGFSLLEIVCAMALSSMIMLTISSLLPELIKQYKSVYRQFRLEQSMRQVLFKVEKDLRRAGFVKENTVKGAVSFSSQPDGADACLIISYDLNHNGNIETQNDNQSEIFGYRLQKGVFEQHRGASDCSGNGWEKITDASEIELTYFDVETVNTQNRITYFIVRLNGRWSKTLLAETRLVGLVQAINI